MIEIESPDTSVVYRRNGAGTGKSAFSIDAIASLRAYHLIPTPKLSVPKPPTQESHIYVLDCDAACFRSWTSLASFASSALRDYDKRSTRPNAKHATVIEHHSSVLARFKSHR